MARVASGRHGTIIAGRYRLEQRIGAGGMGEVYRATHVELGVPVAVKLLSPAIAGLDRAVKRFRREARAAARLKSAHIVHIYDFGVDGEVPFLVMELLEGENLAQRLGRVGRLSLAEASALIDQAGKGLGAAHARDIVHRDVKPSNFFLAQSQDGEVLKVLDFGIAKPKEEDVTLTSSHEVVGSPLYMSPEQASGAELDRRTDVWSLAAVAFRMLTGSDAFAGAHTSAVLVKICSGKAPRASAFAAELSASVDAFFAKAFAAEIEQRFQTAAELSNALSALAAGSNESTIETSGDFYRTEATLLLAPSGAAPHRPRRWPWLFVAAPLLTVTFFVLRQRAPAPMTPRHIPLVQLQPSAPKTNPPAAHSSAPAAPSAPTAPSARRPPSVAPFSSSSAPRPARVKIAPPPTRSTSTAERAPDRNARDPLFGL